MDHRCETTRGQREETMGAGRRAPGTARRDNPERSVDRLLAGTENESRYEERLRILVGQAWDLRGTPYLTDACEAIVELHYHKLELQEQAGWDALERLDPFVRECLYQIVKEKK